ncbi:MAG: serine hydrolase domain-containing protein [Acidimicrobiales bacterium]|jgi:CubicO group peptidase (beta-lactamase class C family)
MSALETVATWGAAHVAAAVVDLGGTVDRFGELEDRFALSSVTKLLTSYAVLVGCEEHTVALDDPAGPAGSTVAHLLAHASGLAPNDPARVLVAPGTRRIYSSAGFEVLASHLEVATGISFADYLAEAVLAPLGMGQAELRGSAAAGATATLADCVAFAGELLRPKLVTAETLERATRVAFPGLAGVLPGFGRHDPCDWGLGFELRDGKSPHWTGGRNSPSTFGHFGQSGPFVWVDPVAGIACVVLSDRPFGPWATTAWPEFADAVLSAYGP